MLPELQMRALRVVCEKPSASVGDLQGALSVHRVTGHKVMRALKERGLVVRRRVLGDARRVQWMPTPAGRALVVRELVQ